MEEYKNSIIVIFEIIDGKEIFLEMLNCYNGEEIIQITKKLNSIKDRHFLITSLNGIDKKYINILKRDSEGIIKISKRKLKKRTYEDK